MNRIYLLLDDKIGKQLAEKIQNTKPGSIIMCTEEELTFVEQGNLHILPYAFDEEDEAVGGSS